MKQREFAGAVQQLRKKFQLTQEDLAKAFGLAGNNVVSRWELGTRKPNEVVRRLVLLLLLLPDKQAQAIMEKLKSFGE